jgi:hypothetical protein
MQEEENGNLMHLNGFGKGQGVTGFTAPTPKHRALAMAASVLPTGVEMVDMDDTFPALDD